MKDASKILPRYSNNNNAGILPRDRVLTALSRKRPDKTPRAGWWTPTTLGIFHANTGADDPAEYFGYEAREVFGKLEKTTEISEFVKYFPDDIKFEYQPFHEYYDTHFTAAKAAANPTRSAWVDEWGIGYLSGELFHFTRMLHPMKGFTSIKEIESYPFPEIVDSQLLEDKVSHLKNAGYYVTGNIAQFIFETAWYLRDMDELLMDFMVNKDFAAALLEKIMVIKQAMAINLVKAGVDQINMGDDVGMQNTMIMSPETWREWLKPYLKRLIAPLKKLNPELHVFYHSDGWLEPIIPDLLEVGIDILNPVQPECMDPEKLKSEYGDKLSFWGTISDQTTMIGGTPDDVTEEVRKRVEILGSNGGLVLSPSNCIMPDMPWQNILALFDAIEKYG